jgi:hypothetical protein
VCVCVLTRWPFGRVRLVLSSHVAQIMCVGRHHCAHHGTSNQFHVQCQPVLFFYKPKRPATTLFFISLCSRQNKTRKWLCNSVVYTLDICVREKEKERTTEREYQIFLRTSSGCSFFFLFTYILSVGGEGGR